ncbi:hypothetical protein [Tsuneonella sp. HG222]
MRNILVPVACAALLAPAAAIAADPCPRAPADAVAGYGEPAGTPEAGRTAYMPAGLTMLGKDVPYVLVMRQGGDGPVEEIAYRLGGVNRKTGSPPEGAIAKLFDESFDGGSCSKTKNSSCGVAYDPPQADGFSGAELNSGSLWIEGKPTGNAIGLIRADADMTEGGPLFLVCVYEPK